MTGCFCFSPRSSSIRQNTIIFCLYFCLYILSIYIAMASIYSHSARLYFAHVFVYISVRFCRSICCLSIFCLSILRPSIFLPSIFWPCIQCPSIFCLSIFSPSIFFPYKLLLPVSIFCLYFVRLYSVGL